jgi:hypothetical protein
MTISSLYLRHLQVAILKKNLKAFCGIPFISFSGRGRQWKIERTRDMKDELGMRGKRKGGR